MKTVKLPWRVKSLKRLCLTCIARNIAYWSDYLPEDCDSFLYILSPFEELGSGLTQDILNTLVELEQFKSSFLHLLLHPSLVNLDLSGCLKLHNVGDMALKLIYKRCRKIKRLNLLGRARLCTVSTLHGIPSSPMGQCLRELRINHDSLNDTFLQLLRENCVSLASLHLFSCRKLTEAGFLTLGSLRQLQELFLSLSHFPNFTDKVLKSLLGSLENLRSLSLSMARINLHSIVEEKKPISILLSSIHLECTAIDDASVDLLTSICLELKELAISHSQSVTMKSLRYLLRCTLSLLEICNTGIDKYNSEFKALLNHYGIHLHHLRLCGVRGIDVGTIAAMCPYLETLSLRHCSRLKTEWIQAKHVLRSQRNNLRRPESDDLSVAEVCTNLESLVIDCLDLEDLDQENLKIEALLTGATGIRSLSLISISSLDDESIKEIMDLFDSTSLKHFDVSQNRNVGVQGIKQILAKCSRLETLQVTKCDVVRQEFNDLVKVIKKHNSDVVLNHLDFW